MLGLIDTLYSVEKYGKRVLYKYYYIKEENAIKKATSFGKTIELSENIYYGIVLCIIKDEDNEIIGRIVKLSKETFVDEQWKLMTEKVADDTCKD